jgi:hypothetical protein
MNNGTEMPPIQWGEDTTFDTLGSILKGWTVRLWFEDTNVILVCEVLGIEDYDRLRVKAWSETAQDYITPLTIEADKIRKVEVM